MSEDTKKETRDKLGEQRVTHLDPELMLLMHCPWCGLHLSYVTDVEKDETVAGRYSSKEGWER